MYAVIADGGRQYKVEEGQEIVLSYRDVPGGSQIAFDRVLAFSGDGNIKIGTPVVAGATVTAEVIGPEQADKIYIQKFRRRKNYRRRTGHRQLHTRVKIVKISA